MTRSSNPMSRRRRARSKHLPVPATHLLLLLRSLRCPPLHSSPSPCYPRLTSRRRLPSSRRTCFRSAPLVKYSRASKGHRFSTPIRRGSSDLDFNFERTSQAALAFDRGGPKLLSQRASPNVNARNLVSLRILVSRRVSRDRSAVRPPSSP